MNIVRRIQYNAPVTLTFALISLAVLALGYATSGASDYLLFSVHRAPLNDLLLYPRLVTHVLGHANMTHYFNNFVIILLIGPMLEEKYGSKSLVLMMLLTALVTGVLFLVVSEHMMLGASGIVFMMILLSSFTNLQKGRIPLTLMLALLIYLGREAISGATVNDNISHLTHIIGGLCGAIFGYIEGRKRFRVQR